jgi:hypothetical protein
MAVVVDDGHLLGAPMVELPGSVRPEHEVFVDKTRHIKKILLCPVCYKDKNTYFCIEIQTFASDFGPFVGNCL